MAKVAWNEMTAFEKVIVEDYKLFEGLELMPLETYEGMDTRPAWEFKAPMATGTKPNWLVTLSDGRMLNRELLKEGLALVYRRFDFQLKDDFLRSEAAARGAERGLWAQK